MGEVYGGIDYAKLQNLATALSAVKDKFTNITASKCVDAASNTEGVELSINNAHRAVVDIWVYVGGAPPPGGGFIIGAIVGGSTPTEAIIEVYGSVDGVNWRFIESATIPVPNEWMKGYITGFPYIKVSVPTTGIDVCIEIAANPV